MNYNMRTKRTIHLILKNIYKPSRCLHVWDKEPSAAALSSRAHQSLLLCIWKRAGFMLLKLAYRHPASLTNPAAQKPSPSAAAQASSPPRPAFQPLKLRHGGGGGGREWKSAESEKEERRGWTNAVPRLRSVGHWTHSHTRNQSEFRSKHCGPMKVNSSALWWKSARYVTTDAQETLHSLLNSI